MLTCGRLLEKFFYKRLNHLIEWKVKKYKEEKVKRHIKWQISTIWSILKFKDGKKYNILARHIILNIWDRKIRVNILDTREIYHIL